MEALLAALTILVSLLLAARQQKARPQGVSLRLTDQA